MQVIRRESETTEDVNEDAEVPGILSSGDDNEDFVGYVNNTSILYQQ